MIRNPIADTVNQSNHGKESEQPREKSALGNDIKTAGLTAGVATLFIVLRLFAVAEWNWNSASVIIDSLNFSDVIPIVFGTLSAAPVATAMIMAILLPLSAIFVIKAIVHPPHRPGLGAMLLVGALTACTFSWTRTFHSWALVIAVLAFLIVFYGAFELWKKGIAKRVISQLSRLLWVVAVITILVLAAVADTPWSVRESIALEDRTIQGYVLEVQPGFVKVITDDRNVIILNSPDIKHRTVIDEG